MVSLTSQLIALRRLAVMESERALVTQRLTSGLKLADRTDSTRIAALSGQLTRSIAQLSSVQTSLNGGIATVQAAASALRSTGGTLESLRSVLTAAKDPSADLSALQSRFKALTSQLRSNVSGASFAGVNLLATNGATRFDAAPADERGQTYAIGVDPNLTRLLDTMGTSGILQRPFDLSGVTLGGSMSPPPSTLGLSGTGVETVGRTSSTPTVDGLGGTATMVKGLDYGEANVAGLGGTPSPVAGRDAATPSSLGLSGSASAVTGAIASAATAARADIGTFNYTNVSNGDTVELQVSLNNETKLILVRQRNVQSGNRTSLQNELNRAIAEAGWGSAITAKVAVDNKVTLETTAKGNQTLAVTSVAVTNGDDVTTSTLGLTASNTYSNTEMQVGSSTYRRFDLGAPNFTGIDRTDQLRLRIDGVHNNGSGGSGGTTIDVDLTGVSTAEQLATAIDDELKRGSLYGLFGATTENGHVVVYHKNATSVIRVSSIVARNGNGSTSGTFGLTTGSGTGSDAMAERRASVTTGSDFASAINLRDGAALSFALTVGGASRTLSLDASTVEAALRNTNGYTNGSGTISTVDQLATVVRATMAAAPSAWGLAGVSVATDGQRLRFELTKTPATGDSVGMTFGSTTSSSGAAATFLTGSNFSGSTRIDENDVVAFKLTIDGVAKEIMILKTDVETALANVSGRTAGSGGIANIGEFALVVQAAVLRAGVSNVRVEADGQRLRFTSATVGTGSISMSDLQSRSQTTRASALAGSNFSAPIAVRDDARIEFQIAVDNVATTVRISKETVETALRAITGREAGTGTIADIGQFASVVREALSQSGVVGVSVVIQGSKLRFDRDKTGDASVTLSPATAVASTSKQATFVAGSNFVGPVMIESGASIGFDLALDDEPARRVAIRRSTVEAALGGRNTINTVSEFAQVVSRALSEALIQDVAVNVVGDGIELGKTTVGAGRIRLSNVEAIGASVGGSAPRGVALEDISLTDSTITNLGASDRAALIDGYIRNLDEMVASVASADNHLARVARQLDIQSDHTARLQAIETARLNRQVKIDIDGETAKKAALDARLALARQAISIISESRKNVLNILTPQLL